MNIQKTITRICCSTLLLVLLCALNSCSKEGRQDITSTDITVGGFHTINIQGTFTVYLMQDSLNFVSFSGERKHVETCTALIEDSVLSVDGSTRGEFLHPAEAGTEVYVHYTSIIRVNVNADCKVYTTGIMRGREIGFVINTRSFEGNLNMDLSTFYFWNNPNGTNLTLSGNCDVLKLWQVGLCSIDAQNLLSEYVLIEHGSQNTCKVHPIQKLEYSITNTGDIVYYGNPAEIVPIATTGTGSLIQGQ